MSTITEDKEKKTILKKQNSIEDFLLNIENYGLEESERIVSSPRTIEACKLEGILPEEIKYKLILIKTYRILQKRRSFR